MPVCCGNGFHGAIVFTKGYKEPDLKPSRAAKSRRSRLGRLFHHRPPPQRRPSVHKYLGRWSIEVFFKEAKQRLGLGQEQGRSFAAQVFSITQAFLRYSLLAYLLEHDEQSQTIGEIFRQLEEETVSSHTWSGCGNTSSLS